MMLEGGGRVRPIIPLDARRGYWIKEMERYLKDPDLQYCKRQGKPDIGKWDEFGSSVGSFLKCKGKQFVLSTVS